LRGSHARACGCPNPGWQPDRRQVLKASVEQVRHNVTLVSLDGRLDVAGVQAVESDFNAAVAAASNVLVELSKVPFIASLGLRLLVAGSQTLAKRGGKMVLIGPDESTMRVLKTTGIDQLMQIRSSVGNALASF
jgi:anti-sigma B factor antagonist